jgi:large subunit ribosomal protein L10
LSKTAGSPKEGGRNEVKKMSKADTVEAMRGIIAGQKGTVLAEYRGLTVAEITNLRKRLREVDAEFRVVKNTLIRRAAKDSGFSRLEEFFIGPTAIGYTMSDPVSLAKAMREFSVGNQKIRLKAGYLDGKVLSAKEIEALADVPKREVLLSRLVGGMAAPITRLAQALSGPKRKLVCVLQSIHDLKSKQVSA